MRELEVAGYDINKVDDDRLNQTITLADNTIIKQCGGKLVLNNYDQMIFSLPPPTHTVNGDIYYPDGTSFSHWGGGLKYLKPYSGCGTMHLTNGKSTYQHWEEGQLVESKPEEWDYRGSISTSLPDPFDADKTLSANVWNGHIVYHLNKWVCNGSISDNKPNGKDILTDNNNIDTKGQCYEGFFKDGLHHCLGLYTFGEIRHEGEWINGTFQNPTAPKENPTLHFLWKHSSRSMGGGNDEIESKAWETEAKLGSIDVEGFCGVKIEEITCDTINRIFL